MTILASCGPLGLGKLGSMKPVRFCELMMISCSSKSDLLDLSTSFRCTDLT